MAEIGESWVKEVLNSQGYNIEKIGNEDVLGIKDILGVVIEEKDWKDPVIIDKNNIYVRAINGKKYRQKRSQITNYGYQIKKKFMEKGIYRFVICVYVVSNLLGRRTYPIYFRKFGTIFVVGKEYFPLWLKSLERTYLGESSMESHTYYMGGK